MRANAYFDQKQPHYKEVIHGSTKNKKEKRLSPGKSTVDGLHLVVNVPDRSKRGNEIQACALVQISTVTEEDI